MSYRRKETIGACELYLGDCLAVLPTLGKDCAVITDPPYGGNYNTDSRRFSGGKRCLQRGPGRNDRTIPGDNQEFDPTPWLMFSEVILWGANYYAQKLPIGSTLVWLKKYEQHYGSFLSDAEIGWQRGGVGVYAFHAPDSIGRRRLEFTGSAFGVETAHPFQKPLALMDWCIKRTKAHTILDPFMGSGTTLVACAKLGRRGIGIESEEKYFDIAAKRIDEATRQGRLFEEPRPKPKQHALFGEAAE